MLDMLTEENYS